MVVGQPRALTLFLRPRLARTLLRWPLLALLLLRIHPLALGFLLRLRSLVRCGSLRGPQPGSSSELECSAVRLAAIPYRVSPGFSSIDAGMYVRVAALHRRSPPLSAVLPSAGGLCAVTDALLPRRPRLCPSWLRLWPPPRCYYDRSLCFFWLIVLCVSQPKMSRGVVLYGHRKWRVPWIPPELILSLSRTLSLSSDL